MRDYAGVRVWVCVCVCVWHCCWSVLQALLWAPGVLVIAQHLLWASDLPTEVPAEIGLKVAESRNITGLMRTCTGSCLLSLQTPWICPKDLQYTMQYDAITCHRNRATTSEVIRCYKWTRICFQDLSSMNAVHFDKAPICWPPPTGQCLSKLQLMPMQCIQRSRIAWHCFGIGALASALKSTENNTFIHPGADLGTPLRITELRCQIFCSYKVTAWLGSLSFSLAVFPVFTVSKVHA